MVMPLKIDQWRRVLLETFRSKLCRTAWKVQQRGAESAADLVLRGRRITQPLIGRILWRLMHVGAPIHRDAKVVTAGGPTHSSLVVANHPLVPISSNADT